ncbi:sodium:calcium antiporter [Haloarculaceae archaeon H-GB1-1]|nr:sodium:calcium antiporter [Haloarculaceae archaeon H-GB1-1]
MAVPVLLELSLLAVVATAGVWKGSDILERAAEHLSVHYGLPPAVKGAVVVAIGSSFPELASVVISTLQYGSFDLGVGAIVGSAIFNVLVIPSLSGIFTSGHVDSDRTVVYKEAQFYMLAVSVVVITFALAVIYAPVDGGLRGRMDRTLAFIPVALYGLYVFIQYQDTLEYRTTEEGIDGSVLVQWGWLAASLVIIVLAVELLVHAAVGFGDLFGTPPFLWGLTVIAASTSLPDTLVSVRAARAGEGVTSMANVFGSNTFDLLVALPVGVLLAGTAVIDFAIAVPMLGVLTLATVLLFTLLRTDLSLTDAEAYVLLGAYVAFVVWLGLETLGVTTLVPGV